MADAVDQFLNGSPAAAPTASGPSATDHDVASFLGNTPESGTTDVDKSLAAYDTLQAKYGTPGQQAIAGLEAAGQGVAGPLSTLAETKLLNVPPEDIRGRREANPTTHTVGEVAGFVAPALLTGGESLLARASAPGIAQSIGKFAAAPVSNRIAATGIKTGFEMAALQGSDELSKLVTQDPNQSVGSAATNIGLNLLIGGGGGLLAGVAAPAVKRGLKSLGLGKIIDDAKGQYEFRQSNPDLVAGTHAEIQGRVTEMEALRSAQQNLKSESLARAMPELTPETAGKVSDQTLGIANDFVHSIEKAADDEYLKGAVPKLQQHLDDFMSAVTDPMASFFDKFNAIDSLKRAMQDLSNYKLTAEDTALGNFTKNIAHDLRTKLEDTGVWGAAGDVQRQVNKAIHQSIKATADFEGKFTSKLMNERVVDPNKIQTYLNQTTKGKAGLKTNVVSNYLDHSQKLVDTINRIYAEAGLETPLHNLAPTPILARSLNKVTTGTKLGNWLFDKGLASLVGEAGASSAGGAIGGMLGHPAVGAVVGEKMLGPVFTSIAKPLMESATRSEGVMSAVKYAADVAKGERLMTQAAARFFEAKAPVLAKELIPDTEAKGKLAVSLDSMQDMNVALNAGAHLNHYLPDHGREVATTAAVAQNYLKSLKPQPIMTGPFGSTKPHYDRAQQAKYDRALAIAQQPLMALHYAKQGTLLPQDVLTLKTVHPGFHRAITNKLTHEMIEHQTRGGRLTYGQKASLSLLMGTQLEPSLSAQSAQAIMLANAPRQSQPPRGASRSGRATGVELRQINKVNDLYPTRLQQRQMDKHK